MSPFGDSGNSYVLRDSESGDSIHCYPDEIYEQGTTACCRHCCEAIVLDKNAFWRRQDGGTDLCADSNDMHPDDQTHEPWRAPPPTMDTIDGDLTAILSDTLSDEQEDYDIAVSEDHPDNCENHIYRVVSRLQHFEELLREAPNMLKLLNDLSKATIVADFDKELTRKVYEMVEKLEHYLVED